MRALASPDCSAATAPGRPLGPGGTTSVAAGRSPFGVAATPDGRWAFATVLGTAGVAASVEVLRLATAAGTGSAPAVTVVRTVPLPSAAGSPAGAAVTPDGKYLLVADGAGAVVISVARAEAGTAGAVLGSLAAPARAGRPAGPGSAIEVAVSPDSRFAFVTLEYEDEAVVFNLAAALARGFGAAAYVGAIPLGSAAVGMAVSPDGRWLYATSEGAVPGQHPVGSEPVGLAAVRGGALLVVADSNRFGAPGQSSTLSVVDVSAALAGRAAIVGDLPSGGFPRDMSLSPSGTLLVSDYTSGRVQAIATAPLPTAPAA